MFYPIKLIDRKRDLNSASVPYTLAFALHCTGRQAALTNAGLRVRGLSRCLLLTLFRHGAVYEARTRDNLLGRQVLYQLS